MGLVEQAGASRLLEDVELPGSFLEWLEMTRVQFDRALANGVRRQIEHSEAQGDWAAVRDLGEAYLVRDPVDEIVVAALIRADAAAGDRPSARRRLEGLRGALSKAYGLEPSADALAALTAPADHPPSASQLEGRSRTPSLKTAVSDLPLVMVADFDSSHLADSDRPLGGIIKSEIVAGLSAFREFYVSSAPVSLSQGDSEEWLTRGASYVLGGTLWRSAGGVRLAAQLIRASAQQVIWSERMEISYPQITDAVDRLITKIIGAVSPVIDADLEMTRFAGLRDQYARYVAARRAAAEPADFHAAQRAVADLEALITEDPGFILPYLPLARLYNNDFAYTRPLSSGKAERERAFALAKAALSRDRSHIHAYTVVGWCHLRGGQWNAARTHFEQALALNPFHADRVMEVGYGYLFLGETDRASELLHRSLMLNPTPKDSYYTDLANLEIVRGDYDSSLRFLDLMAKPMTWSVLYRAMNATLSGRPDDSLSAAFLDRARSLWAPDTPFTSEAVLRWVDGDHPFALPELRERFRESVRQTLFSSATPSPSAERESARVNSVSGGGGVADAG